MSCWSASVVYPYHLSTFSASGFTLLGVGEDISVLPFVSLLHFGGMCSNKQSANVSVEFIDEIKFLRMNSE
jgi:hypothetical protein